MTTTSRVTLASGPSDTVPPITTTSPSTSPYTVAEPPTTTTLSLTTSSRSTVTLPPNRMRGPDRRRDGVGGIGGSGAADGPGRRDGGGRRSRRGGRRRREERAPRVRLQVRQPQHEIRVCAELLAQLSPADGRAVDRDLAASQLHGLHATAGRLRPERHSVAQRQHVEAPLHLLTERTGRRLLRGDRRAAGARHRQGDGQRRGQPDDRRVQRGLLISPSSRRLLF